MLQIPVNQTIPFSNVDGDGNRFSIFVQQCNLNCVYCHNSETINMCCHCGICVEGCPTKALSLQGSKVMYDESQCINCDQCITVCPYSASPKIRYMTVHMLLEEIKPLQKYIRGITVSGGEPTLYHTFFTALFKEVKKLGLTCYVDTNGAFDVREIHDLIEVTDGFLFDVKAIDYHKKLCGVENPDNLNNLIYLLKRNKIKEVRTVLLKNYVDIENTIVRVKAILESYERVPYRLINAHLTGLKQKQKALLSDYVLSDDSFCAIKARFNTK